jgi:hypothetical protein
MPQIENRYVSTEKLAYWYFRLIGSREIGHEPYGELAILQ